LANGANVLDKHVAGRNDEEKHRLFIADNGFDHTQCDNPQSAVEQADIAQVDAASHLIVFVDGPSHGVGNEVQRAIDRYEFGIKKAEILCLVQEENYKKLFWMIKGKQDPKYPNFHMETYKDLEDAKSKISNFLTMH
jgi:hypothetical protein